MAKTESRNIGKREFKESVQEEFYILMIESNNKLNKEEIEDSMQISFQLKYKVEYILSGE